MNVLEEWVPNNVFRTGVFEQVGYSPIELTNIKQFDWNRSVDAGVADCTLTLYNSIPVAPEASVPGLGPDTPGAYTWVYGIGPSGSPGQVLRKETPLGPIMARITPNPYGSKIIPDRVIRSYQGYGADYTKPPEKDPHLVCTGTWLIDDVIISSRTGLITIKCRDLGRLLLDQIVLPPIVPENWYPLQFSKYKDTPAITQRLSGARTGFAHPSRSSVTVYHPDTSPEAGHYLADAFDLSADTYWLSIGNQVPNADYSFEYVEGVFPASGVSGILCHVAGGPYTAYISVFANGSWQGSNTVPYNRNAPQAFQPGGNGSDIPYIMSVGISADEQAIINFPLVANATKVRITFTNLWDSGVGPYVYRAAVRTFEVLSDSSASGATDVVVQPAQHLGNYGDYTDIIKLFCAWGGFYWPLQARVQLSDGTVVSTPAPGLDPVVGVGQVWGDFESAGTAGIVPLTVDIFDKKPLMDGINFVRDILGFVFFIGDLSGVVWRLPNVFGLGNFMELDAPAGPNGNKSAHTTDMVLIDERTTLTDIEVTLSSRNVRERVFVATVNGQQGAAVAGFNPYPNGEVRVGGWTDQKFGNSHECEVMADFIAMQQLFLYRVDKVFIAGNPQIQIDDQVKIHETITGEDHVHYVKAIASTHNEETGEWDYQMDTCWLGQNPLGNWVFSFQELTAITQQYLRDQLKAPVA
jgi:hypothetical protein